MIYLKRGFRGFAFSAVISIVFLMLTELILSLFGVRFIPMTPEFVAKFPSETIAMEVDIILYGLFGFVFSIMTFIYDIDRIGFVIQNIIYVLLTSVFWIPAVTFMWQLQRYPIALYSTLEGYVVTYIIIIVVTYKNVQKNITEVNYILEKNQH